MELELNRTEQTYFEQVLDTTIYREETLEMIVPDACPDILRILDTEGWPCLPQREAVEGAVRLTGCVRTVVLYQPDGAGGLWKMEAEIPVQCTAEQAGVTPVCQVFAVPRVTGAETRLINPRKVLIRVNLAIAVQAYAPRGIAPCSGAAEGEGWGVQQRTEVRSGSFVACVRNRDFTFSDELTIPGSKSPVAELLKCRGEVYCGESKIIGNKLIFKGGVTLLLLCRGMDAAVYQTSYELPFSQIMEVSGAGEEAECRLDVELTGWRLELDPEEGRQISVELSLLAQAVVREERTVELLTDAYSTMYPMTAELEQYPLVSLVENGCRRQTVREILETGVMARSVYDLWVSVGEIGMEREAERCTLTAQTRVTILYEAEESEYLSVTRQIPVTCQLELPEGCQVSCLCTPSDLQATATAGGIETRYVLDFQVEVLRSGQASGISALRLDEETARDSSGQPSIVLRQMTGEEELWDIAKAYSTTMQEIMQANELEGEQVSVGQLLLIPRKR